MKPIFAKFTSEAVTAELRAQLDAAIAALPPAHCLNPTICSSWTAAGWESALAVLQKLIGLPPRMAESFANSFAKGTESLLAQQDKQLASRKESLCTLLALRIEETPLQYRKGNRRAITGLEVAEERDRDAL
jgi:hypothetical protein